MPVLFMETGGPVTATKLDFINTGSTAPSQSNTIVSSVTAEYIALALTFYSSSSNVRALTSAMLDGVSGTIVASHRDQNGGASLMACVVVFPGNGQASGTVELTFDGSAQPMYDVYELDGYTGAVADQDSANNFSSGATLSLDVGDQGCVIGVSGCFHGAARTTTWGVLTEDSDASISFGANSQSHSGAHKNYTAGVTAENISISLSASANVSSALVVSFNP
jgi:hypothetical protein